MKPNTIEPGPCINCGKDKKPSFREFYCDCIIKEVPEGYFPCRNNGEGICDHGCSCDPEEKEDWGSGSTFMKIRQARINADARNGCKGPLQIPSGVQMCKDWTGWESKIRRFSGAIEKVWSAPFYLECQECGYPAVFMKRKPVQGEALHYDIFVRVLQNLRESVVPHCETCGVSLSGQPVEPQIVLPNPYYVPF